MGELLATLLYLLHIEQWPTAASGSAVAQTCDPVASTASSMSSSSSSSSSSSFEKIRSNSSDSDDTSYVYVESFVADESEGETLDRDAFLKLAPFANRASGSYSEYVITAVLLDKSLGCAATR